MECPSCYRQTIILGKCLYCCVLKTVQEANFMIAAPGPASQADHPSGDAHRSFGSRTSDIDRLESGNNELPENYIPDI